MKKTNTASMLWRIKKQPKQVIDSALSKIPDEILLDCSKTVVDLAMGDGSYLAEISRRRVENGATLAEANATLFGYERSRVFLEAAIKLNNLQGATLAILRTETDLAKLNMKFDVIIGNPPYQAPKKEGKKGLGGDNSLFLKFIDKALDLVKSGGYISMLTPSSAITKTTVNGKPTPALKKMMKQGALVSLDLDADDYFTVGSHIGHWFFEEGAKQGSVLFTKGKKTIELPVQDIFYCPPKFEEVEFNLFKRIFNNREGTPLYVTRNKPERDYCMNRFGYPKIEKGGPGVLGFDAQHAEFMMSQLGLWLLDYVRRHDQFIYHRFLSGINIPANGFELSPEEEEFIGSTEWRNFGVRESK
jgi:hypothetical protein